MPVFEYQALDSTGKTRKGIINADSLKIARDKLKAQKLFPTSLQKTTWEAPRSKQKGKKRFRLNLQQVNQTEYVYTLRQLATLLSAGLPLDSALTGVMEQIKNKTLQKVMAQIRERVREGSSLAGAMEEHPRIFSPTFTAMIEAGESSGTLEMVMERLAEFAEQQAELRRKIQSTMAYPALMLIVGLGVVFFLMSYVVPRVTSIFLDLQQTLPLPTIILIKVSSVFQEYWLILLIVLGVLGLFLRWYIAKPKGKALFDRFILHVPLVGEIVKKVAIARFSRTLGTLLKNEVTLLTALDIVRNVVFNDVLARAIDLIRKQISEGQSIVGPITKSAIFPPVVSQMVSAGEQSGSLDEMLLRIGDTFENEVASRLTVMTSLLEPVMILFLGALVGFVVLAVLLPIFEMSQLVQ